MVTSISPEMYKMYYPVFSSHHKEKPRVSSISMFRRPKQDLKNIDTMSCHFRKKRFNHSMHNSILDNGTNFRSQISGLGSVGSIPERYGGYGSPIRKQTTKFLRKTETFAIDTDSDVDSNADGSEEQDLRPRTVGKYESHGGTFSRYKTKKFS